MFGPIAQENLGKLVVDRIWSIRGSYSDIPKAAFYLLKGDYTILLQGCYAGIDVSFVSGEAKRKGQSTMFYFLHGASGGVGEGTKT